MENTNNPLSGSENAESVSNQVQPAKRVIESSKCPKCGEVFHCSTSSKCWCYEIDVPAETMEKLQEEYESCLCPDCLKEYAR